MLLICLQHQQCADRQHQRSLRSPLQIQAAGTALTVSLLVMNRRNILLVFIYIIQIPNYVYRSCTITQPSMNLGSSSTSLRTGTNLSNNLWLSWTPLVCVASCSGSGPFAVSVVPVAGAQGQVRVTMVAPDTCTQVAKSGKNHLV